MSKNIQFIDLDDIENSFTLSTQDISASRAARYFFQKSKIIYIEKSKRWVQSGSGSYNRLETANKIINTFPKHKICSKMIRQDYMLLTKMILKIVFKTFYKNVQLKNKSPDTQTLSVIIR